MNWLRRILQRQPAADTTLTYCNIETMRARAAHSRRLNAEHDPIAALNDDDRSWLEAHGWRDTRKECKP